MSGVSKAELYCGTRKSERIEHNLRVLHRFFVSLRNPAFDGRATLRRCRQRRGPRHTGRLLCPRRRRGGCEPQDRGSRRDPGVGTKRGHRGHAAGDRERTETEQRPFAGALGTRGVRRLESLLHVRGRGTGGSRLRICSTPEVLGSQNRRATEGETGCPPESCCPTPSSPASGPSPRWIRGNWPATTPSPT